MRPSETKINIQADSRIEACLCIRVCFWECHRGTISKRLTSVAIIRIWSVTSGNLRNTQEVPVEGSVYLTLGVAADFFVSRQ
jgi:hypothetical protein